MRLSVFTATAYRSQSSERGNEPLGVEELQSLQAKDSGEKQQNTQQVVGNEYGVKHEKPKAKPGSGNKTQE